MEYNYPKFTPEMKKTHTILIPNMAITQFRLLEYALRYDGYKCEILGNSSLGLLSLNALVASDTLIVPLQCEYYALEGLSQLLSTVRTVKQHYNPHLELQGVVFTMYDSRLKLTQQVVDEVEKYFPGKTYHTMIPRSVKLAEAPSYGKPVLYYEKYCKASFAYKKLADEVVKQSR